MAVAPFPLHTFSGLNLRDASDSIGDRCIDCLNVDLDRSGTSVRSRDGTAKLNNGAMSAAVYFLHRQNTTYLLTGYPNLYQMDSSGAKTTLASSIFPTGAVNFGTPASTATYVGATSATIKKVVTTTYSSPTATVDGVGARAMPQANALAVQDTDNRLVVSTPTGSTGPNGATSSMSHVWFSDAGNPESWSTNNYVQLTPGDGEVITQIVSWRGAVYVFKQTRLFIFYGTSIDASGNPVFNYRTVQLPSRVVLMSPPLTAVAVAEDGIYYVANDGVYVTTGDVPSLLSEDLYPLATGTSTPFFTVSVGAKWSDLSSIYYFRRRLFVSLGNASSPVVFVYDIDSANWVAWSGVTPLSFTAWDGETALERLYFGTSDGYVKRFSPSFTDDSGTAISSYYRTGFYDLGTDTEKIIMDAELWGTGTVAYSTSSNFDSTLGTTQNVTLGTSPAIGHGYVQKPAASKKGTVFSHKFASVSGGAWAIHRCTQNVEGARPPGMEKP